MAFQKNDPRINRAGRKPNDPDKVKTKREIRDSELLSLLRKIKPHLSDSIVTAAKIMKNDQAADTSRLKAAVILLDAYKELVNDVYNGEDQEDEGLEVQPQSNQPVFSLKMINSD